MGRGGWQEAADPVWRLAAGTRPSRGNATTECSLFPQSSSVSCMYQSSGLRPAVALAGEFIPGVQMPAEETG